ncbi:MAG TPA: pitrilysin family protein [Acidimicrobiales bacterium]|nr:pitrilysin family protein [Acidimicrobiales bacterium]
MAIAVAGAAIVVAAGSAAEAVDVTAAMTSPTSTEEIRETRLANGVRIVTERMPEARSVSLGVWVGVGGRDEPGPLAGASHFLEHLLFKGTAGRSARQIAETVDAVGGEMNAFTNREHTAYYTRLPAARVDLGLEILGDVLTAPAFRPHEVEAERQVIVEEILMNLDVPEDHVHTLLAEAMFPGHPLGREVLGTRETVEAATRDQIAAFFERWYRPRNLVVVAAGDLDHDRLVEGFATTLGTLDGGERPDRSAPGPAVEPRVVLDDETEQVHVAMGWRGVDHHDDDRYALSVANQVLGGGMSSRLFQEIREERGLCYSVYSWASTYDDSGSAGVYAGTAPSRVAELLSVVDDEIGKLAASGVTEGELAVAKGFIEGSLVLGLEDSGSRMARLGRSLMARDEIVTVDEQLARIRAVTADDVAAVAARVYGSPRALAVIGHVDDAVLG